MKLAGHYRSAIDWARMIRDGETSSVEVVQAHIDRINQVNPLLNAVVHCDPEDALAQARSADQALAKGSAPGPLHGVPITLKDSIDTRGMVTTWGSAGRKDTVPDEDATVVKRLRAAGAIVLGKTNTPELTIGGAMDNDVFGPTWHPWNPDLCPGFSSGGSAANVAIGGSPLDFGSDTGGSIREPAHFCGIAGIKPSANRVPRTGHAVSYDLGPVDRLTQIGPMARCVADLAIALNLIAGADYRDPEILPFPIGDMARIEIGELRIAWYTDGGLAMPIDAIANAIRSAAAELSAAGARVREAAPAALQRAIELHPALCYADGGAWLERLLTAAGTPGGGRHMRRVLEDARSRTVSEPMLVYQAVDRFRADMTAFMADYDAIVCPVESGLAHPPLPPGESGSSRDWTGTAKDWAHMKAYNLTGWPAVSVPAGVSGNLPFGIQVVARPWRDDIALAVAAFIEQRMGGFVAPPEPVRAWRV